MENLLEIKDLAIGYGKMSVTDGINASLKEGCVTAVLGANGAGKSTLLKTLTGELRAMSGEVVLCGRRLQLYKRAEISRLVAIVTTDRVTNGGMSVEEVVATGRYPHIGLTPRLSDADREIVSRSIENVGIGHKRHSRLSELSDGERQKCFIARALAQDTRIIVLDEPFSFLDIAARIEIFDLLNRMAAEQDKAVLLSSHDVSQAVRMASELWLMYNDGKFVQTTPLAAAEQGLIGKLFGSDHVIYDVKQHDFVLR